MDRAAIRKTLSPLSDKIASVQDDTVKDIFDILINLLEVLAEENETLKRENQALKTEVNRLKGEQGKPQIRKQTPDKDSSDHSSEKERQQKKKKGKRTKKKGKLNIHRTVLCDVDTATLPPDAVFKSYEDIIIQDLKIEVDNIQFRREIYYSPSLKKTFSGQLPEGYYGDFGPGIRSWVLGLYHDSRMTQPAIRRFLKTSGVDISKATISRMLTERHELFHREKEDIITAGLTSTDYQHIDDTSARVKGKNQYVHVLCNPYYTAYFTLPKKNRLGILEMLCREPLTFDLTDESIELMGELGLPKKHLVYLREQNRQQDLSRDSMATLLKNLFPNPKKHQVHRQRLLEACAIISYKKRDDAIKFFIADDAPQFKKITDELGLCWIHEGRHYKKLNPVTPGCREILDNFIEQFWIFYHRLLDYKLHPTAPLAKELEERYEQLFTPHTGYGKLNDTIRRTAEKKKWLLLVLTHPHLPLHNNDAELGARLQARIRDIHLHTMSALGTKAKDTFATISQTAKKLGVNLSHYLYDRITKKYQMPSLADIILKKSSGTIIGAG